LIVRRGVKGTKMLLSVQLVPEGEEPVQRRIDWLKNWK